MEAAASVICPNSRPTSSPAIACSIVGRNQSLQHLLHVSQVPAGAGCRGVVANTLGMDAPLYSKLCCKQGKMGRFAGAAGQLCLLAQWRPKKK